MGELFCALFGGHRMITAWSPSREYDFCLYCRKGMLQSDKQVVDRWTRADHPHTEDGADE